MGKLSLDDIEFAVLERVWWVNQHRLLKRLAIFRPQSTNRCFTAGAKDRSSKGYPKQPGLCTVVMIERKLEMSRPLEHCYYLSSLVADAGRLLRVIRTRWHVENRLHWVPDVAFAEG